MTLVPRGGGATRRDCSVRLVRDEGRHCTPRRASGSSWGGGRGGDSGGRRVRSWGGGVRRLEGEVRLHVAYCGVV